MPLSSVFEKLKLRRGSNSNPPSPTSSSGINREGRASSDQYHSRKSVDQPRVSSNVSRDAPARAYGAEQAGESTGFRGQELVGAHNHVDGNTEVARNANAALERDPNNSQHQTAQVPQQYQQRESRDAPRENLDQGHGRTGSGLTGRGEGKGLPPIPGVSGRDDRDHAQHAREPVAAAQRTPSKVPASSRNVGNNQFDADGFPIVPKTSSSSSSSKSESGLPRSHGTFALPTVPQTPAFSDEVQAGLLDRSVGGSAPAAGLRERFELDAGSMGYIPVEDHRHGLGFGSKDGTAGSSEKTAEWREIGSGPLIKQHQLTTPRQLAPYKVTDPNVIAEESRRFVTAQSKVGRLEPNHIGTVARGQGERDGELATAGSTQSALSAYIPIREYAFHPSPPGATDPSPEHIQRHLALLSNSFTHSRMSRIGAGASKPGKYTPLIPGIPVSTTERDRELINQREGLVSRIAREETVAERSGARGIKPKNGLDERSVEVFKQAGWESKVGVLDTVDVKSRVLEPVIQEHVAIIETEVYELMIFRDIHKYHIYPFIQPIHDPSPTILPTRHLFKDAQGQWREVIGDEAAERVLGTKIDRSEGSVYTERWIESVGGIEYEAIEKESVVVGRRGWVQLVGERLVVGNSNSSIGRGHVSSSSRSGSNAMRIATDVESKPRKSSFSATSPGRPVGQRSSRDAPPVPTDHVNSHRSSGQIGRAI